MKKETWASLRFFCLGKKPKIKGSFLGKGKISKEIPEEYRKDVEGWYCPPEFYEIGICPERQEHFEDFKKCYKVLCPTGPKKRTEQAAARDRERKHKHIVNDILCHKIKNNGILESSHGFDDIDLSSFKKMIGNREFVISEIASALFGMYGRNLTIININKGTTHKYSSGGYVRSIIPPFLKFYADYLRNIGFGPVNEPYTFLSLKSLAKAMSLIGNFERKEASMSSCFLVKANPEWNYRENCFYNRLGDIPGYEDLVIDFLGQLGITFDQKVYYKAFKDGKLPGVETVIIEKKHLNSVEAFSEYLEEFVDIRDTQKVENLFYRLRDCSHYPICTNEKEYWYTPPIFCKDTYGLSRDVQCDITSFWQVSVGSTIPDWMKKDIAEREDWSVLFVEPQYDTFYKISLIETCYDKENKKEVLDALYQQANTMGKNINEEIRKSRSNFNVDFEHLVGRYFLKRHKLPIDLDGVVFPIPKWLHSKFGKKWTLGRKLKYLVDNGYINMSKARLLAEQCIQSVKEAEIKNLPSNMKKQLLSNILKEENKEFLKYSVRNKKNTVRKVYA